MISFIKGRVDYIDSDEVILENHGIGYQIYTPSTTASKIRKGQEATLHTYLYIKEDILALYGFLSKEEMRTFQTLLTVSGVGPKVAVATLSTMTVADLYYAIFSEDVKGITKTPGVGPKLAKKMILDLKDKLKMEDLGILPEDGDDVEISSSADLNDDTVADTIEAMIALGYSNGEAYRAVHGVKGAKDMDTEALLKEALKIVLTLR